MCKESEIIKENKKKLSVDIKAESNAEFTLGFGELKFDDSMKAQAPADKTLGISLDKSSSKGELKCKTNIYCGITKMELYSDKECDVSEEKYIYVTPRYVWNVSKMIEYLLSDQRTENVQKHLERFWGEKAEEKMITFSRVALCEGLDGFEDSSIASEYKLAKELVKKYSAEEYKRISDEKNIYSYAIDISKLFECYVRVRVAEYMNKNKPLGWFLDSGEDEARRSICLESVDLNPSQKDLMNSKFKKVAYIDGVVIPDIILKKRDSEDVIILDVKFKNEDNTNTEGRHSDRYQLLAYANLYNASKIGFIFPGNKKRAEAVVQSHSPSSGKLEYMEIFISEDNEDDKHFEKTLTKLLK